MSKDILIPKLCFPEFNKDEGWDLKEFSSFIKLDRGSSPRPIQEFLTKDESGVNWIKIGDTKNAVNSVIYQVEEKITREGAEKSRKVEKGELILANSMSFGKTYKLALEGCIYDGWFVLRKYERHFNKSFLLQLLNSDFMQNQYKRLSAGGIVQNISSDIVYNSKLFHTTLQEQQKIASCLSSLDEVIATNSQKLELLNEHKKGLMQNLFPQDGETVPKYRFPEFKNDGEWVEKSLIDTADKNAKWSFTGGPFGSNLKASDYTTVGIRIIQLQNIGDGEFNDDNKIYTSPEKADELLSCNIYAGDVILSKMGDPVGRACIIPNSLKRCVMASDGIRLVVDEKEYSKYFIYSLINSKRIREVIEKKATGSTRKRIGLDTLREIELIVPKKIEEQQKIASCLSSLDELITAQVEKIAQLKLHKQGLMQGLFPKIND
ncbi:restriction endonuclease subunit S [Arcicella rosea]|uniref:Type I restriction enzyme S subunit n=1 Tax=Arcicella rosea TaxID=502909 RepID=A0A841EK00_9BACT|nr:restriction endonuclease subunit S [Arcicella rosea]MBB6003872.1 type I restriction enzyme S subunit [Arcicella rosea]